MFDPFNDFESAGYLRNVRKDKDPHTIKRFEHDLFEANIDTALTHLAQCDRLGYHDFLTVHRVLFADYYPWAGQDRAVTMPNGAVKKGAIRFSHPQSARLAVEHGLLVGQDPKQMAERPGEVMGLFAYGHPFLDGNGRTMLLVHIELCHRAGFSIAWHKTDKAAYLEALSREIDAPEMGALDRYLLPFKGPCLPRPLWGADILAMRGLDGLDDDNEVEGDLTDPVIAEKYQKHVQERDYEYAATPTLAQQWNALPGKGQCIGKIVALSAKEVIQDAGRGRHVVWDRTRLTGAELIVGKSVTIYETGKVVPKNPSPSLGR